MYNDKFYGQMKEILQMEGWTILNDPYTIRIKKLKFAILEEASMSLLVFNPQTNKITWKK